MENYKKSTGDLLVEFFSEEVPARMQFQSGVHLEESFKKAFDKRDIRYGEIEFLQAQGILQSLSNNWI